MDATLEILVDTLERSPALLYVAVALLGLCVGSFLNVVIHRLPIMMERAWREEAAALATEDGDVAREDTDALRALDGETDRAAVEPSRFDLAHPPSACPACGSRIRWYQNVPIVSWLALRGRCAACGIRISPRYPLIEATTAALSVTVIAVFGPTTAGALALVVTWLLLAMTMIDIDHQLLPDSLTLPLMWIGLLASLLPVFADVRSAVIGAAAGYLALWSVYWVFKLVTGKEGMGYGDFKLLAAFGALLGWQALPAIILLSSLVGAVVGLTLIAFAGRGRDVPMAFGPFLAAAGWIAMLGGDAWIGTLLGY